MKPTKVAARLRGFLPLSIRLGLLGLAVLCLGAVAYVAISGKWARLSSLGLGMLVVLPSVLAAASAIAAIRLPKERIILLVREVCFVGLAALAVEVSLAVFFPASEDLTATRAAAAHQLGMPFDTRSVTQVVEDLNAQGTAAYPTFPVSWVRRPDAKRHIPESIYPLSNISNATIVECNESGKYLVFSSDEHGFHNPPGLSQGGPIQIAAIGTSFTLGRCVDSDQNMIARIREGYPKTLNFGMTGAGPFTMLGVFREYVEPLRPRVVLWFIFPGTLDTRDEASNEILKSYLDPTFRQGLLHRQGEVDEILKRSVPTIQREFDQRLEQKAASEPSPVSLRNIAKLWQIRSRLLKDASFERNDSQVDLRPFVDILRLVNRTVTGWGGDLYAVYVPDYAEVVEKAGLLGITLDRVRTILEREGIPLIDGVGPFVARKNPASLYALHMRNHFNADGHRLMAETILQRIRADLGGVL